MRRQHSESELLVEDVEYVLRLIIAIMDKAFIIERYVFSLAEKIGLAGPTVIG